jgi:cell division protein FtsZ
METETNSPNSAGATSNPRAVTIFGVGTAGVTMAELMAKQDFNGAKFVGVNTDATTSMLAETVQLEAKLLRGLGTGGDPERGRELAEENFDRLKSVCTGVDVVILMVGLGGGTGSGVSPVIARAARESGALVLAFVTLPFNCEGNQRQRQAQVGLDQLRNVADGVICLPHQKAVKLLEEHCGFAETFCASAKVLIEGVRGVWRLLMYRGLIEIHYEELCAVLRERNTESCFATVDAAGLTRARDVVEMLPGHPLLDGGEALKQADTVIVSLMGGPDLSMADVNRVMEDISGQCRNARVIMGAVVDESFRDRLAVTVIASRRRKYDGSKAAQPKSTEVVSPAPEFETELLHPSKPERPGSRLVPPAPNLTAEQRNQILAKQTGKAQPARRAGPRMKQATLPLDIVNKGRFDKSEPTIHKGEDLDLPTYVRRGIALN